MSLLGKKVTIYLANGVPSGIRHVEIANWSGQAIACPRSRINELAEWSESSRPGVYFLFEKQSGDAGDIAYIGETQNVRKRLKQHLREKDFWSEAIFFTNKDNNLSKAHVMQLEARLTKIGREANRYRIEVAQTPSEQNLPRADLDAMEEFILQIRTILGVLGHRILESINPLAISTQDGQKGITNINFMFNVKELTANGRFTDEGFVLIAGSQISGTASESMPGRTRIIRENWIADGVVARQGENYRLTRDEVLSSSSYAAAMVAGTSRSGPKSWKDQNGVLLGLIEEEFSSEI